MQQAIIRDECCHLEPIYSRYATFIQVSERRNFDASYHFVKSVKSSNSWWFLLDYKPLLHIDRFDELPFAVSKV